MKDSLEQTITKALFLASAVNVTARENAAAVTGQWGEASLVIAPLSMADLYVLCRRRHRRIDRVSIGEALNRMSVWSRDVDSARIGGLCRMRLIIGDQLAYILRLGSEPNNGVLNIIGLDEIAAAVQHYEELIDRIEQEDDERAGVPPPELHELVLDEVDRFMETCLHRFAAEKEPFVPRMVGEMLQAEMIPGLPLSQGMGNEHIERFVEHRLDSWTHRLFELTYHSTLRDVSAYDLLRLPSGKVMLLFTQDFQPIFILETFDDFQPRHIGDVLVDHLKGDFDDQGVWQAADALILLRQLRFERRYPIKKTRFWRRLLADFTMFEDPWGPSWPPSAPASPVQRLGYWV